MGCSTQLLDTNLNSHWLAAVLLHVSVRLKQLSFKDFSSSVAGLPSISSDKLG